MSIYAIWYSRREEYMMSYRSKKTRTKGADQATESDRSSPSVEFDSRLHQATHVAQEKGISLSGTSGFKSHSSTKTKQVGATKVNSNISKPIFVKPGALASNVNQNIRPQKTDNTILLKEKNPSIDPLLTAPSTNPHPITPFRPFTSKTSQTLRPPSTVNANIDARSLPTKGPPKSTLTSQCQNPSLNLHRSSFRKPSPSMDSSIQHTTATVCSNSAIPSQPEDPLGRSSQNIVHSKPSKSVGGRILHTTVAMCANSTIPSQLQDPIGRPPQNIMHSMSQRHSKSVGGMIPSPTRDDSLIDSDDSDATENDESDGDEYDGEPLQDNGVDEPVQDNGVDEQEQDNGVDQVPLKKSKPSRPRTVRSRSAAPNWPSDLKFDEKDEVLTVDTEGNHKIFSGPIQPRDVDNLLGDGVRCIVNFNDLNQPIRKAGSVLVKYLGSLAKIERFCPIGEDSWHDVNKHCKVDIVEVVRAKFVIPSGKLFDNAILRRVCKHWKHYKYTLKRLKFNPDKRSKDQIINDVPLGHTLDNWMRLVEYWYSPKGKKRSLCGKEARASQSHVHTTGCISYANKRADFVESKGNQPSHLEFFELTHKKAGGGFVDNTISSQLMEEANSKVEELVRTSSPSKSRAEIENDVFDKLMYEEENPKRPVGFGFGVKQSHVFGVHGILRKRGYDSTTPTCNSTDMENMKVKMTSMEKENKELRAKVDQSNHFLLQTLNAISDGKVSDEFFNAVQTALRTANSQAVSAASGHNSTHNGLDDTRVPRSPS